MTTHHGWRSRWAAVGAAVAVSFGAGGLYVGNAATTSSSSFVPVTPVRVLDTRTNLGLTGVFTSPTSRDLPVTGSIATSAGAQVVVPTGATAVSLNVTVVGPTAAGFLSVRPANASGAPTTSSLNFSAGQVVPNAVTVQLPTGGGDAGKIEITYNAFDIAGPTTHVLIDIVGYFQATASGPADGAACTVGTQPGTIINGYDHDHNATTKCFLGIVTTFAGSGSVGVENGDLVQADFNSPVGVGVDLAGNVYVADQLNHRIRKINPEGIMTTFAGSSVGDDDGVGAAAQFNQPRGLAVDAAGNVYVADQFNHLIRKITPDGVVTTFAGTTGDPGNTDNTGTAAKFSFPSGVAIDAMGNVYVADTTNNRIRKITPGQVVTTFAGSSGGWVDGTGTDAKFSVPSGIAIDAAGNLYVADSLNHRIRKITPGQVVTTLAGSGTAGSLDGTGAAAQFNFPTSVAVDTAGNVYVADTSNSRIRKITPDGVVTTLAGSSTGFIDATGVAARFNVPSGIAVDATGNVYVADTANNRVRQIN